METKLGSIQVGQEKVAFEAVRTNNPSCRSTPAYICQKGVITFTRVRINEGQGFKNNGTFIAPSDGIYHFEVSFNAQQSQVKLEMKTTLSNQIFRLYAKGGGNSVMDTATLKMKKGDGIYVTNESDIQSYHNYQPIRADYTYPMTFKGFKIN